MSLQVCALLIPRATTETVAMTAVSTLRTELTRKYPGMSLPESDIIMVEDILALLRRRHHIQTINKAYTPLGGSLKEET